MYRTLFLVAALCAAFLVPRATDAMPNHATTELQRTAAERLLERWGNSPDVFAVDVLGISPWSKQVELLRAVAAHDRVAVRSGHKVSKSNSAAILALWFVLTRDEDAW
jgi:hypothetical protein